MSSNKLVDIAALICSQEISCCLFSVTDLFPFIETQGAVEENETKCSISDKIVGKKIVYMCLELLKCQVFCTSVFVIKVLDCLCFLKK